MQKRKITVIALILVCVAFVSSGTLAYFTAEEKTHNVITPGLNIIIGDSYKVSTSKAIYEG